MMKKNGFTLAEVLITLAIIGVVATMTLPALMTNTGEQQAKTGLKKGINTLTEAVTMNESVAGFGYDNITIASPTSIADFSDEAAEKQSLFAILANNCSIDYSKDTNISTLEGSGDIDDDFTVSVHLRDGSAILYNPTTAKSDSTNAKKQNDDLPLGFDVILDTNGAKGPNVVSHCLADGALSTGADDRDETQFTKAKGAAFDISVCDAKKNRAIKDQFFVRLRGNTVQPSGKAAVWALEN